MWLSELNVTGFRNLAEQTLEFDPRINLVFGPNGSGKTNLLESISVLASGRSFRTIQDSQILGFEAPHFKVAGKALNYAVTGESPPESRAAVRQARVYFSPAERKHYFFNRREIPKRALYAGWLPVTVFLLDDRRLVAGPPAMRRAFLDDAVGKISRTYRFVLSEYLRVLSQRNALLRKGGKAGEFDAWEKRLAELGTDVSVRRAKYWKDFGHHFSRMSRSFLPADKLTLSYRQDIPSSDDYLETLALSRMRDRECGHTRRGPHRDDFKILLNSRPLRSFGSAGQQRMAALALALAESETAFAAGRKPIYLMDDVAAELDDYNSRLLFDLVRTKGQLFYAGARPPLVEGRRFHVKKGQIRQV